MEQQKKKSKVGLIIALSVLGSFIILLAAFLTPSLLAKSGSGKGTVFNKKYVSDYDFEWNKTDYKSHEKWNIRKVKDYDDDKYLYLYCSGEKTNSCEYLDFKVYDSTLEAKSDYKEMYRKYRDYRGIDEEDKNWFIGWEPDVCDASILSLVYLQDNVIIIAELDIVSEWPEPWPEEDEVIPTPVPAKPQFDRSTLKEYVLNNAEELRDFVLEDILGD